MPISSLPISLLVLGGNAILKSFDGELGMLQPLCDILKQANAGLVIDDFKSVSKRREININGHLHSTYIKSIENSVEDIKKGFKKNRKLKLSLIERNAMFASKNRMIQGTLDYTCNKIISVFKNPVNVEVAFKDNVQVLDDHNYFGSLIDVMIENGIKNEQGHNSAKLEPYLFFSKTSKELLTDFMSVLKANLSTSFAENFRKELKRNDIARHAYSIYMQHALFLKQSENDTKILEKLEVLTRPPLTGLIPESERSGKDYFSYLAGNSDFVGREDAVLHLKNFLNDKEKFRWSLINGEGGSGKSRLAYELCKDAYEGEWNVGFYEYDNDEGYSFNKFTANKNTLIIFDYIGTNEKFQKVCSAIKNINSDVSKLKLQIEREGFTGIEKEQKLLPRIRFVLIERFLLDHQLADLNDQKIRRNFFPFLDASESKDSTSEKEEENKIKAPTPYPLRQMNDEEKWKLICQIAGTSATDSNKASIMKQVAKIDPQKRPLFIFMAAGALKEKGNLRGWNQKKTLEWYLNRTEDRMWKHHNWYVRPNGKSLKNIIWLTTIAGSLLFDDIVDILDYKTSKGFRCFDFPFDESLDENLSALFYKVGDQGENEKYNGIQPDIVAEYYIINHLNTSGKLYFETLLDIAWTHFPKPTLEMLLKAGRDFLDDPKFLKIVEFLRTKEYNELGKFFYSLAYQYSLIPDYPNIIIHANRAIELLEKRLDQDDIKLYLTYSYLIRGNAYKYQFKYDIAIKNYKKALKLDSKYSVAHYHLFEIYQVLGKEKKAVSSFHKGLDNDSVSANDSLNQGVDRFINGKVFRGWYNFNLVWIKNNPQNKSDINSLLPIMTYVEGNEIIASIQDALQAADSENLTTKTLDFYSDYLLHEFNIVDGIKKGLSVRFITDKELSIKMILNGSSIPIHKMNSVFLIKLSADNVDDYLSFFCEHVHGENGSFQIIKSLDDIKWVEDFDVKIAKQVVKSALEKVNKDIIIEESYWILNKLVHYSGALFGATFKVYENGTIDMIDDTPIAATLPTKCLSTFGSFFFYDNMQLDYDMIGIEEMKANNFDKAWQLFNKKWLLSQHEKTKKKESNVQKKNAKDVSFIEQLNSNEASEDIIKRIQKTLSKTKSLKITPKQLNFYPDLLLYEFNPIEDINNDVFVCLVTNKQKELKMILNGNSKPIHKLNEWYKLELSNDTVSDYLSFFCKNTHGDLGAYHILESNDNIKWAEGIQNDIQNNYLDIVNSNFKKIDSKIIIQDNCWIINRLVVYGSGLFSAKFKIDKNGRVDMLEDEGISSTFPSKNLTTIGCFYKYTEHI